MEWVVGGPPASVLEDIPEEKAAETETASIRVFRECSGLLNVVTRASGITAMPRSILRNSEFTSYLNLHVHSNGKPLLLLLLFWTSYDQFFFRIAVSVIPLGYRKGKLLICLLVHDQHRVKDSHPITYC